VVQLGLGNIVGRVAVGHFVILARLIITARLTNMARIINQ
jgi:hypothetical protein